MNLVAVCKYNAIRRAILHQDLCNRCFRANLRTGLARRVADRIGDCASATARQPPRTKCAIDLSHVMVQQHVGCARRSYTEEGADDSRSGHRRLEHISLEP